MKHLVALGALSLTLAACDQQEAGPVDSEVSPTSGLDDEQTLPGERSLADETETGPTRARDADQAAAIPARFQGVWDDAGATCARGSEMRLEIAPGSVTFYESFGRVTGVVEDGEDLLVDLDMEGEGKRWSETRRLWLVNQSGETLLHTGDGTEPRGQSQSPRRKCD